MTAPLDYDEELYVSGAYFARNLSVYHDFVSVQPPLYIWILSAIFDLVGGWYLLTARVVTGLRFGACALLYSLLPPVGPDGPGPWRWSSPLQRLHSLRVPWWRPETISCPAVFSRGVRLCLGADGGFSRSVPGLVLSGFFAALAAATKYPMSLPHPS